MPYRISKPFGFSFTECKDMVRHRLEMARDYRARGTRFGRDMAAYCLQDALGWHAQARHLLATR